MKIDSYAVTATAQRSYQKLTAESLNQSLWSTGPPLALQPSNDAVVVELSGEGRQAAEDAKAQADSRQNARSPVIAKPLGTQFTLGDIPTNPQELKLKMLDSLLFALTGKRVNTQLMELLNPRSGQQVRSAGGLRPAWRAAGGQVTATRLEYEREAVSYNAQGVVKTADGKTITLDIGMQMSREFYAYSQTTLSFGAAAGGRAIDPLVINYGGTAASLTGEKFSFDLDADGVMDQISFAGAGSGFLALDKNGDGKVNDGSELFGPGTGNGFGELRGYDSDGNHWIDENDDVFAKLRIWSKDKDGNDQLFTLQELGIGAIYLGDVKTDFSFYDATGNQSGQMRSTSFFLREDGSAGTVSHIDLVV